MANRIDELQGRVKKSVGDLLGNDEMKRQGEAQAQQAKLEREAEGVVDKGVGKAQEALGEATGDTQTELEGKARQVEGDIERSG